MHIRHLGLARLDGAPGVTTGLLAPGTDPEEVRVDVAVLDAGSSLPRHPAGRDQSFYVVAGTGQVAGADDVPTDVGPGDLVTWDAGEQHTTWATTALTAVIVQRRRA
ncbi:Cupin domain-containing protein [Isoptericola sp. CG 20/1183]|uniref:Cupin domain-containing protein n=1 Tax=Isoptericola halotolerans TaxID=300560 RepID=A0ABX5EH74_9MICO|nr:MULTISPECIES: cupin domain-containing protein [Isoptericola]PRZ08839.1 Cupin domain-containing protein [Isoptericola halotolerans]PRZ10714.1 Cupin domain-containing protein [Isoptericola sp. CG 20/1183]